ncbi:YihY/virulence factor BrkB family protein [Ferruginibacter paludis]|uniref:YihY/virulence factor BrkB family protein n=1 Tax=Ferruginibacter paludis TaxID=1310417 RepID=UPI0025B56129|nr:YihY/virulence factor BrkB family protein [Ferruginibacter paludis]MDN3659188.1 YihY/virulence factor BrkB family protein [Ferruginibacter paludis]
MSTIKALAGILKSSVRLFLQNDPLRMAGATAFFTMFALPPILIIIVQVFGLFIDPKIFRHELFISLSDTFGKEAVRQVGAVIKAVKELSFNLLATVLGFVFLLFVATTVFKVVRSSISQIWSVADGQRKRVLATLQQRLHSLILILLTGLLFSVGILIETVQVFIGNYFIRIFPSLSALFNLVLAFIISTLIVAIWFLLIFRYLTDVRPKWRIAWAGALFTSVLFAIGKIVLHWLLTYNNITNFYGASASIVLLLLFVFYAAMILYFGAAFTKILAQYKQQDFSTSVSHNETKENLTLQNRE